MKILVADNSHTTLLTDSLHKLNHEVIAVSSCIQAIEKFQTQHPDLVILDLAMDGLECATKIRAVDANDWVPIVFLSESMDTESITKAVAAGADDYLGKPFSELCLTTKIKAMQRITDMRHSLRELTHKLSTLSATDPLTGLYNRLQFDKVYKENVSHIKRHQCSCALLFIDLDKFKMVNDVYGHHVGDLLLIEVANRLKLNMREEDFLARIGGNEFAIILKEISDQKIAGSVASNIIEILSPSYNLSGNIINISVSIGISFYPHENSDQIEVLKNADAAMYHAKKIGRNNYQYFSSAISGR